MRPAAWRRRESDSKRQAVLTSVAPWVFGLQGAEPRAQATGPYSWDHPSPTVVVGQLGTEETLC